MAADEELYRSGAVNGIDLTNYFPEHRSYNTVLYVHKKFRHNPPCSKPEEPISKLQKETKKENTEKGKKKKKKKVTHDKSQQYDVEEFDAWTDKTYKIKLNNDSVLEQTIKFAKNIVPFVIPPSRDKSPTPVFYTIKASQKSRKKSKKRDSLEQQPEVTYKKERSKKVVETFINEKGLSQRESFSVKETVSYASQNNTLDEIHINPSLCCSLSEISDKKPHMRDKSSKKLKKNELIKLGASASFEALATDLISQSGEGKVKIHLMNETDKNLFSNDIRMPIINAIRECFLELNNNNNNAEVVAVKKIVKCNTQKLDHILDKITGLEKKFDDHIKQNTKAKEPEIQVIKPSKLERLGQDLLEVKENSSEEECYENIRERKLIRTKTIVAEFTPRQNEEDMENNDRRASGEASLSLEGNTQLGARPKRIPARFCWTDAAARKNVN